ncbi:hypothetical protein [Paenibacillus ihumii]|uniref:hypothetical protein n=1 Tax=Paenibacillus ihumii TaxID=687436 RepID=UPI0011DE2D0C|nr:hypothetical protein [Paenibacillus ihumii]
MPVAIGGTATPRWHGYAEVAWLARLAGIDAPGQCGCRRWRRDHPGAVVGHRSKRLPLDQHRACPLGGRECARAVRLPTMAAGSPGGIVYPRSERLLPDQHGACLLGGRECARLQG